MEKENYFDKLARLDTLEKVLLCVALIIIAVLVAPYFRHSATEEHYQKYPVAAPVRNYNYSQADSNIDSSYRSTQPALQAQKDSIKDGGPQKDHVTRSSHKLSEIEGLLEN